MSAANSKKLVVPVLLADNRPVNEWIEPAAGQAQVFKTVGEASPMTLS